MMKISHKEYLEQQLISKKMELKEVETQHRINLAEFEVKKGMLRGQIDSIELQLQNGIQ